MMGNWLFRFTKPDVLPAGSKLVAADEAEKQLLSQLKTKQRPEEDVRWDLSRLYSYTKHHEQAFAEVQRLVQMAETLEKKAQCYLAMGQLMEQMQNFEMAIKYYSQALSLEPINNQTWYFIHNNLGYCLNHFGRYREAQPYCCRAIKIDPLRHNAYKNLGISLEGQGDYANAAKCYIKAVQTNASDPRALRHLEELIHLPVPFLGDENKINRVIVLLVGGNVIWASLRIPSEAILKETLDMPPINWN